MTREEAIEVLKKSIDNTIEMTIREWEAFDLELAEAIDMAIEALQREEAEEKGYCHRIKPRNVEVVGDLISRADAIKAVAEHFSFDDGCSNIYKDIEYYKGIAEHILKNVPSAEAENRHYIKIYADDEPSVKAEKLYQICGETQNREVTEWLKEYFPSADAVQGEWIMHIDDLFPCESTQECSVCHAEQPISISDDNFCPNCGARMKGGAK